MLHQSAEHFQPATIPAFNPHAYLADLRAAGIAVEARLSDPDHQNRVWEVLRAEVWIAGARECGLELLPWRGSKGEGGVLQFSQDEDGDNDFSDAATRFAHHPAADAVRDCRKGVVFETLCAEFGVDPGDPDLCAKINARLRNGARS